MRMEKNVYFNEMDSISLLTLDEEKDLIQRAADGDKKAQDKLVVSNLRYVVSVANKFKNNNVPLEDLIEAGNLGLIKASKMIKPGNNVRFITYATWWIKAYIQEEIRTVGLGVRLPGNMQCDIKNDLWAFSSLDVELSGSDSEGTTMGSLIADSDKTDSPETAAVAYDTIKELYSYIDKLSDFEKQVITYRMGLDGKGSKSLSEIASIYGTYKEKNRLAEKKAINKLRVFMREYESVNEFLGLSA